MWQAGKFGQLLSLTLMRPLLVKGQTTPESGLCPFFPLVSCHLEVYPMVKILLANSSLGLSGYGPASASRRKGDCRVWARGTSASHAATRSRCIAAAVARCCKWVLASPRYLECRRSLTLTPCERVPSTPTRAAYIFWNSAVVWCCRAASSASCWARVRTVSIRGWPAA